MSTFKHIVPLVAVLAFGLTFAVGVSGAPTRASATLQLNATLHVKWGTVACPAGTPVNLDCYGFVGKAVVPGLGNATATYTRTFGGGACASTLPHAVIEVAGKGEIDLLMGGPECVPLPPTRFPFDATITGGTGSYAAASGTFRVDSSVPAHEIAVDIWTGTLTVVGLDFELTPPALHGALSKTVRAAKNAKRARVRYAITAQDTVDGAVPVSCTPPSGYAFGLGRTKVTCSATDSSGNTGQTQFVITVKRHQ